MARIATYPQDASISVDDLLVGTDAEDSNITKNYKIGDVKNFIAGSQLATAKVTVTSEQLLSLDGGGAIELIEAPGTGKVISIISIACFVDFNSIAFNFNESLDFKIGTNTQNEISVGLINSSEDKYFLLGGDLKLVLPNTALTLFADTTATVTTGDSPLTLSIAYRIVDFS